MKPGLKSVLVVGDTRFVGDVTVILAPLPLTIASAASAADIRSRLSGLTPDAVIYDDDSFALEGARLDLVRRSKRPFVVVSSRKQAANALKAEKLGAADYIIKPYNQREFIARVNAVIHAKKRVTCIGGGTGLFTLLMGLKSLPNVLLTSIVSMTDDGGSSGRLRADFGILPPGDIRRSLVALSNAPEFMSEVMQYRFERSELKGHSFGNLFLTALANLKGSMAEAVRGLGDILNIQGIVLPAASTPATLCAMFEDGSVVRGESKIDLAEERHPGLRIRKIWHEPPTDSDPNAYASILNCDILTIGPGDLFTSVVTNFLTRNIRDAVAKTRAKKVYICNLMTKPGETSNFDALDHVKEVVRYMRGDFLDYVIISNTRLSDKAILDYARNNQSPVETLAVEKIRRITRAEVILADVGHETELVRHDSAKLKNEIEKLIQRQGDKRKWR